MKFSYYSLIFFALIGAVGKLGSISPLSDCVEGWYSAFVTQDPVKIGLVDEVKRNCSISKDIEVVHGHAYRGWYVPSVLENTIFSCPVCGKLAHFLLPALKSYGGTYVLEVNKQSAQSSSSLAGLLHIASLYHEMGHIAHQDSRMDERVKARIALNQDVKEHQAKIRQLNLFMKSVGYRHLYRHMPESAIEDEVYEALLAKPDFIYDLERIEEYSNLGKSFLAQEGTASLLANSMAQVLREHGIFWHKPDCALCQKKMMYKRGKEKRADLFALEKLWHNDRLDVIQANIYLHGSSGFIEADGSDIHPSGFERALYMIGFLASKRVDVTSLLRSFEQKYLAEILLKGKEYLFKQVVEELVREHAEHEDMGSHIL